MPKPRGGWRISSIAAIDDRVEPGERTFGRSSTTMLERLSEIFDALRDDAAEWCAGRSPWPRWPLLVYLAYAAVRHAADPLYRSWFAGLTLVLHELGHLLFAAFGRTPMLLGGSITQLLAPAFVAVYLLLRQHDWFGLAVGSLWLSFSAFELATYVGDANKGRLPLVGFGDDVIHDWDALLTQWRLLNHCDTFAALIRLGAGALALGALGLGAWLLVTMHRAR